MLQLPSPVTFLSPFIRAAVRLSTWTAISDTFTDTNGVSLDAHASDRNDPGTAWVESAGVWDIQSNQANVVSGTGARIAQKESNLPDCIVSADCTRAGGAAGLVCRFTDTSNFWLIEVTGTVFRIRENNAGTLTVRASVALTTGVGVTRAISVTLNGSTITATADGANEISYASATHNQTATKHGPAGDTNGNLYDNFVVRVP